MKLFDSLPVRHRCEGPRSAALKRAMFDRGHALVQRGAAIAVFPEGVNGTDRGLQPLESGASCHLLEHVGVARPLAGEMARWLAAALGGGAWLVPPPSAPIMGWLARREVDRRHAASAATGARANRESA